VIHCSMISFNCVFCQLTVCVYTMYFQQRKCFEVPIQPHALEEVKQTVQSHVPDGVAIRGHNYGFTIKGTAHIVFPKNLKLMKLDLQFMK